MMYLMSMQWFIVALLNWLQALSMSDESERHASDQRISANFFYQYTLMGPIIGRNSTGNFSLVPIRKCDPYL